MIRNFAVRHLRAFCLRTGRLPFLYRNVLAPEHQDFAEFCRRHLGVRVGHGTSVHPLAYFMDRNAVTIGANCSISIARFITHSGFDRVMAEHLDVDAERRVNRIKVGSMCAIGDLAQIIGPVTIGDWVYVAAGARVSRDVPDGTMVVGDNVHLKNGTYRHMALYKECLDELSAALERGAAEGPGRGNGYRPAF